MLAVAACRPGEGIPGKRFGETCDEEDECREGLICSEGLCTGEADNELGETCLLSVDCEDGLRCAAPGICQEAGAGDVDAPCSGSLDCQAELVCALGQGFSGRCAETGISDRRRECQDTLDCLAGLVCESQALGCEPPRPDSVDQPVLGASSQTGWLGTTCLTEPLEPTAHFSLEGFDLLAGSTMPASAGALADFFRRPFPMDRGGDSPWFGFPVPRPPTGEGTPGLLERWLDSVSRTRRLPRLPSVLFRFSEPFDFDDISEENVRFVNIDPDSPRYGTSTPFGWFQTSGDVSQYACENWLSIFAQDRYPLEAGTTYAVLLRNGIENQADDEFLRSETLTGLLRDARGSETDANLYDAFAPLRTFLAEDDSWSSSEVLNAAVFTTGEALDLQGLRSETRDQTSIVASAVDCAAGSSPCSSLGTRCSAPAGGQELHALVRLPRWVPEEGELASLATEAFGSEEVCAIWNVPEGAESLVWVAGGDDSLRQALFDEGLATLHFAAPLSQGRAAAGAGTPEVEFYDFADPERTFGAAMQWIADTFAAASIAETSEPSFARYGAFAAGIGTRGLSAALGDEPVFTFAALEGVQASTRSLLQDKMAPVNLPLGIGTISEEGYPDGRVPGGAAHPLMNLFVAALDPVDGLHQARRLRRTPALHLLVSVDTEDASGSLDGARTYAQVANLPHVRPHAADLSLGDVDGGVQGNRDGGTQGLISGSGTYRRDDLIDFIATAATGATPALP